MDDEFEHFLRAQEPVYSQVISELSHGQKRTHWMWYIFPQVRGLGHSEMAERFAIESLAQAKRYASHQQLGHRLRQCTQLVIQILNREISDIFGYPDNLKFHSSMTLFAMAVSDDPLFDAALIKYFGGTRDAKTIELLKVSGQLPAST